MKKITLLLLLSSTLLIAQKEKSSKMGQTTLEELKMTIYDKDSIASAVVLYEHANLYLDKKNNYKTRTDYYRRIKILNKSSFNFANIELNLSKNTTATNIKAITYNLNKEGTIIKDSLIKKDIFTIKESDNSTVKRFTLPNIKEGSVIEYKYSKLTSSLTIPDWYFQSSIPTIKSEYDAAILGNYQYNIRIIGYLKLDKDESSSKINCIEIPGIGMGACAIFSYGMYNVPAFKEEDYMLSKKNYISRVSFDLKSYTNVKGHKKNYATTWEKADRSLKRYFFNNQTTKKNFFKTRIPEKILNTENNTERAKGVYNFIKDFYSWNGKNWANNEPKIKEAYNNKSGGAAEINLSLYNSLKAAEIDVNLIVLSTRNNGIPTKLYPIIFEYNYVVVKANINGKEYYLDATDKFSAFGQLPIRTLNGEARIIDSNNENSWIILKPIFNTSNSIRAELTLNKEAHFTGNLTINRTGYYASNQRKIISSKNEEEYLEVFENDYTNIEVEEYSNNNLDSLEKPLIENFKINISLSDGLTNKTRINPFFFLRTKENPFKLKKRNYPINYGYTRKNNYSLKLKIPENYKITQLPKDITFSLPNKGGRYILKTTANGNIITVFILSSINKKEFSVKEYHYLKEFYKQIIISENGYIILEKK
jgi:hypothetical protein